MNDFREFFFFLSKLSDFSNLSIKSKKSDFLVFDPINKIVTEDGL